MVKTIRQRFYPDHHFLNAEIAQNGCIKNFSTVQKSGFQSVRLKCEDAYHYSVFCFAF